MLLRGLSGLERSVERWFRMLRALKGYLLKNTGGRKIRVLSSLSESLLFRFVYCVVLFVDQAVTHLLALTVTAARTTPGVQVEVRSRKRTKVLLRDTIRLSILPQQRRPAMVAEDFGQHLDRMLSEVKLTCGTCLMAFLTSSAMFCPSWYALRWFTPRKTPRGGTQRYRAVGVSLWHVMAEGNEANDEHLKPLTVFVCDGERWP
jgi:hypothetical protein